MAYFANGTEGIMYEEEYCFKCINYRDNGSGSEGCPILDLHFIRNYDECNKKDSFLHFLIPRKGIENEQCSMFIEKV